MGAINEMIHQPMRLKVMAALFALDSDAEVDFTFLRNQLELTDGNLGAHLEKLESAGYVAVRKAFVGRKPRTFLRLTRTGRRAFEDYVEALRDLMAAVPGADGKLPEKRK